MITKLLFIAFLSLLVIVPMVLYKSQHKLMANFCLRMTAQASARKLYRLVILILLLTFHFLYLSVQTKEIGTLVRSVDKLANSVETLAKEQQRQGKRLESIEQRPAKRYEQITGYILSSVVSCIVGGGLGALLALIFK